VSEAKESAETSPGVMEADFLPLLEAPRVVVDGEFSDGEAVKESLCAEFCLELEARGLQAEAPQGFCREELVAGVSIGDASTEEDIHHVGEEFVSPEVTPVEVGILPEES
jgi:hypothetical protein